LSLSFIGTVACVCAEGRSETSQPLPNAPSAAWMWGTLIIGVCAVAAIAISGVWRSSRFVAMRWKLSAGQSLLMFLVLQVVGAVGAEVGTRFAPPQSQDAPVSIDGTLWMIGTASMFQIIAVLMFLMRPDSAAHSWSRPKSALIGAVALAAAWFPLQALGIAVGSLQMALGGPAVPLEGHSTLQLLAETPLHLREWLLIGGVVIVAPALEEIMFRGALLGALRRGGFDPWSGILLCALIFALLHIPALVGGAVAPGLAMLFALGVVLGWCVARTGSLAASITAHMLFNALNILQSMD